MAIIKNLTEFWEQNRTIDALNGGRDNGHIFIESDVFNANRSTSVRYLHGVKGNITEPKTNLFFGTLKFDSKSVGNSVLRFQEINRSLPINEEHIFENEIDDNLDVVWRGFWRRLPKADHNQVEKAMLYLDRLIHPNNQEDDAIGENWARFAEFPKDNQELAKKHFEERVKLRHISYDMQRLIDLLVRNGAKLIEPIKHEVDDIMGEKR